MDSPQPVCALLAERHMAFAEGVRGLLEASFERLYLVADASSLYDGAQRLTPDLIILDVSLASGELALMLPRILELSPASRVIVLTRHDQATVARLAVEAGAHGVVLNRCVGRELLEAVDNVLRGEQYLSPDIGLALELN